jgi:hypothetical protein
MPPELLQLRNPLRFQDEDDFDEDEDEDEEHDEDEDEDEGEEDEDEDEPEEWQVAPGREPLKSVLRLTSVLELPTLAPFF